LRRHLMMFRIETLWISNQRVNVFSRGVFRDFVSD